MVDSVEVPVEIWVVHEVVGEVCTPHIDRDEIRAYIWAAPESVEALERIAREGVPVEIWAGSNLEIELE